LGLELWVDVGCWGYFGWWGLGDCGVELGGGVFWGWVWSVGVVVCVGVGGLVGGVVVVVVFCCGVG